MVLCNVVVIKEIKTKVMKWDVDKSGRYEEDIKWVEA